MLPGDVAGVVTDGPDTAVDVDKYWDVSQVTATFSGFESADGIARYEWAVGSAPGLDDVMAFTAVDLIVDDGTAGRSDKDDDNDNNDNNNNNNSNNSI